MCVTLTYYDETVFTSACIYIDALPALFKSIVWLRRYVAVYFTALFVRYRYEASPFPGITPEGSCLLPMKAHCPLLKLAICSFRKDTDADPA